MPIDAALGSGSFPAGRRKGEGEAVAEEKRPVLSVVVRRFRQGLAEEIERSVVRIQAAVATQPGFVGLQNSVSRKEDFDELVTVFAFESREHLDLWESCPVRRRLVEALDRHSHDAIRHTQFGDLAQLLRPGVQIRKFEIVLILIFWIIVAGSLLRRLSDLVLPDVGAPAWLNVLLVSVNVVLISYVLLPWSSSMLMRLKARLRGRG